MVNVLVCKRDGVQHYATIRNFSTLVGRLLSNHGHIVHRRCLHAYSSQELLDAHVLDCFHAQRIKFPKDARCRFTNIQKHLLAPFVVYAHFDSILRVDEDVAMDTTQGVEVGRNEPTSVAGSFQEQPPCSFAYSFAVWYRTSPDLLSPTGERMTGRNLCTSCKRKRSRCFRSTLLHPNNCQRSPRQNCARSTLPSTVTYATSRWEGTKCVIIVTLHDSSHTFKIYIYY